MSCPLSYTGSISYSLVPIVVIHSFLEYENMVLYIINLIPQLVLPWAVHPTIDLMFYSLWLLLCRPWHSIPLEHLLLNLFCGPILFILAIFRIFLLNRWMIKCILVNLLDLLDPVPFLFSVVLCYLFSCNLCIHDVKDMSWCCVLYSLRHLVNCIVPVFQFTSGLCLTNQLYPKNISVLFKSVTAMFICSVCLLISSSSNTNLITSPFLVPSISQNELLIYLWYLNLECTFKSLEVIQKFNNNDNNDKDQYRWQW